jgi:transketolase
VKDGELQGLRERALRVRRAVLEAIHAAGSGHEGTSLSVLEILVLLYFGRLRHDPGDPFDPDRDRLLLSKGHGAPSLYCVLAEAGYLPAEELCSLRRFGTRLQGHPDAKLLPGIDACTGSLGQGISQGLGMALGTAALGGSQRVYVIVGDGELQEGQNWEAAMAAAAFGASNLTVVVDRNGLQSDGATDDVLSLGDLVGKWRVFGWAVETVDGHDFGALERALDAVEHADRPGSVIAETVKGKGVSYMENVVEWHHRPMSDEDLELALAELRT